MNGAPLSPGGQVVGVEPHFCASLTAALKAGKPVKAETTATLADGLAVPTVSAYGVLSARYRRDMPTSAGRVLL